MPRPTILIDIDPAGEVKITVQGHAGPGCHALTGDLEQQLGTTVQDERTREYYLRQRGGSQHARVDLR
ncbi:MAG: DUF2997 domain-containing protein [Candidatus Rokuibacteriota bacterium]